MKVTLQTQLLPDSEQARQLRETMEHFNEAASWLAGKAFEIRSANKIRLQQLHYAELRSRFALSAQMAVRCIAQVCEAYKRDRSIQPVFRPYAAMPFDNRILSFKGPDRVSLLTLEGRILVPFVMGKYQAGQFTNIKGQCDLCLRRDGKWFLLVTVNLPDGTPIEPSDWIGVDLGAANLATTSDGANFSGSTVDAIRESMTKRRRALQVKSSRQSKTGKRPKNMRRKLKKLGQREHNFRRNENHRIAKQLVATAKDTGRGIALEELSGIRERTRFRKPQRSRMGSWAFAQLRMFVEYKARLAGVPILIVNAAYTSQTCSSCGYRDKANRQSQSKFVCRQCGFRENADVNGALNIRERAIVMWPNVAELPCAA
jgi:IS605 OrfB family transposase